jgi:hypothetical protein
MCKSLKAFARLSLLLRRGENIWIFFSFLVHLDTCQALVFVAGEYEGRYQSKGNKQAYH